MDVNTTIPTVLAGCISGSIGDTVFSHNQHGPYTRPRVTPAYPGSPLQLQMAQAMAFASIKWDVQVLIPARLAAWQAYAASTPIRGTCGNLRHVTAREMFIRAALVLYQVFPFLEPSPGPPTGTGFPGFAPVRIIRNGPLTYDVFFDDTQPWVSSGRAVMFVNVSAGPGGQFADDHNFYRGPYGQHFQIEAAFPVGPTSPRLIGAIRIDSGMHRYARVRLLSTDGRLSNPQVLKIFP